MVDAVQHLLWTHRYTKHDAEREVDHSTLRGGLIISLDLTKAFDFVNRCKLFDAMRYFQISEDCIHILKLIYDRTSYTFCHRGESRSIPTRRGIRQGCKAAPLLWLLYLGRLALDLKSKVGDAWLQLYNTIFADDWLCHCLVHNPTQIDEHLRNIGLLFDTLEQYDLCLNLSKTVAIMKLAGSDLSRFNRHHLRRTKEGVFLKIPRSGKAPTLIRLVTQQTWLGIRLSLGAYTTQTIKYRLQSARKVSFLLTKWIRGKGGLTKVQKLKIWQQCVFSSLLHGLSAVKLTINHLLQIDSWCMTQIRHIYQAPVHLDHIPHRQFLIQHRIKCPLELFLKRPAWKPEERS